MFIRELENPGLEPESSCEGLGGKPGRAKAEKRPVTPKLTHLRK